MLLLDLVSKQIEVLFKQNVLFQVEGDGIVLIGNNSSRYKFAAVLFDNFKPFDITTRHFISSAQLKIL